MSNLSEELTKWRAMRSVLENVEDMDERCLLDTLEGATNLTDIILDIDEEIREREAYVVAIAQQVEAMQTRKARHEKVIDRLRTIILNVMDNAGLPKVEGALTTISVTNLKPEVYVEDEAVLPAKFFEPQEPKLNKTLLRATLESGELISGARLGNGRINLQIRRK